MKKKTIKKSIGQFPVIVHEDTSGGYWVSCPTLEGCYSQGESIEEALENIREAITLCLEESKTKITAESVSLHLVTV